MRKLLIALMMTMASAAGFAAEVMVTMRSGVDNSLLEQRKVETAVEMRTVSAPSVAGKIFDGWTSSSEQAFVSRDRHGRALEVARQVIYGETTLIANYVDETVDSDGDGVPDGWERYWYGDLDETATSDTDGDGYDFAAELAAGTDPLMPDRGVLGGVVWADGGVLQYNPDGLPRYRVRSEPEGELFETYEEFVFPGTRVQTAAQNGGTFAYWTTNGVRVADRHGRARDSVTFTMGTEPVDIVAVCESDELRRQQLYWYGATIDPASDTDGDGYTFAEEMAAGTDPLMPDRGVLGGIVWADGTKLIYNPDGLQACVIRSEPESVLFATVSNVVKKGTCVTTEGLLPSDSDFAYWTLNGERVADRHGRAKDNVSVTMGDDPLEIVAVCETNALLRQQLYWYGMAVDPASDTDGDGYTFAEELAAGTDPLMPDRGVLGGVVWADSPVEMMNLQVYEQVQGALVDGEYEELFYSPYGQNGATSRTFAGGTQIWPVVADVNGDGLWDLIVVSETTTNVFVNVGTRGSPQFANCGSGVIVPATVDLQMNSVAKLVEMTLDVEPVAALSATTNGATLLVSDDEGRIWLYEWGVARPESAPYQLQHKVWGGSYAGFANGLRLAAVDWEDDGDLDCLAGTADGKLMLLRDPKVGRPTNLRAAAGVDSVRLDWDPNAQSRVRGYKVYRARGEATSSLLQDEDGLSLTSGQETASPFLLRASTSLPHYLDLNLQPSTYSYKVTSVSRFYQAGSSTPVVSESPATEPVRVELGKVALAFNDASGFVGREVEVPLSVNNSLNLAGNGLDVTVSFDSSAFTPKEIKTSALSDGMVLKQTIGEGTWTVTGTGGTVEPGTGVFLTFVFRVSEDAEEGDADVEISSVSLKSTANESVSVPMPILGVVSLETYDPPDPSYVPFYGRGDLDGDGRLGWNDMELMLIWKDSRVQGLPDEAIRAGDYNGDGVLDNRDYPLMRKDFRTREAEGGDMAGWDKNHTNGGKTR